MQPARRRTKRLRAGGALSSERSASGMVMAAVASFWVRDSPASLRDAAKGFGLGGVAANSATSAVEDGARARWYLLGAGLLLMLWAGIAAVRALRVAAVIAWRLDRE